MCCVEVDSQQDVFEASLAIFKQLMLPTTSKPEVVSPCKIAARQKAQPVILLLMLTVHRSAVSNTIGANASGPHLTFSACLDDLVSVSWRYKIRSEPARFAGCLWHRWLLERLQKALRLTRLNDFVRTIPRCQAVEPICCDQSMPKTSGVGATLSLNALHIRHVTRAFASGGHFAMTKKHLAAPAYSACD